MRRRAALVSLVGAATAIFVGRRAFAIAPHAPTRPAAGLAVTPAVATRDAEVQVSLVLTNTTERPLSLSLIPFRTPITCLIVSDGRRRVPTVPPGVPRPATPADAVMLAPRESRTFTFTLGIFSPPLPPGRYTVTLSPELGALPQPVPFEIRASG